MASTVEICNSALNSLGASNIISLTEDSKNARLLNQRYISVRDAVFRSHNWNCLIKRVELAADTDTPAFQFTYQYQNRMVITHVLLSFSLLAYHIQFLDQIFL